MLLQYSNMETNANASPTINTGVEAAFVLFYLSL